MVNAFGIESRSAANDAMDFVVLAEQQLREIRAVLSGDAGDKRFFHLVNPVFRYSKIQSRISTAADHTARATASTFHVVSSGSLSNSGKVPKRIEVNPALSRKQFNSKGKKKRIRWVVSNKSLSPEILHKLI